MLDRTDVLAKAAEFRRNAEACEKLARAAIYPETGAQLRDLAEQWRVLAERIESMSAFIGGGGTVALPATSGPAFLAR
jgi:hypothetical protein